MVNYYRFDASIFERKAAEVAFFLLVAFACIIPVGCDHAAAIRPADFEHPSHKQMIAPTKSSLAPAQIDLGVIPAGEEIRFFYPVDSSSDSFSNALKTSCDCLSAKYVFVEGQCLLMLELSNVTAEASNMNLRMEVTPGGAVQYLVRAQRLVAEIEGDVLETNPPGPKPLSAQIMNHSVSASQANAKQIS